MNPSVTKSFCPIIIFHDDPSIKINKVDRTIINRHFEKTNEMMELNSHYWINETNKVSSSKSTSSESSESSSNDSISTHISPFYKPLSLYQQKKLIKSPTKLNHDLSTTNNKKRRRGNLPKEVTEFLRQWLIQHKKHPYPAEKEKIDLALQTGLTVNQISNWFINARRRILQPMLESENLNAQLAAYDQENSRYSKRYNFCDYQYDEYQRSRLMDIDEHSYQQLPMR